MKNFLSLWIETKWLVIKPLNIFVRGKLHALWKTIFIILYLNRKNLVVKTIICICYFWGTSLPFFKRLVYTKTYQKNKISLPSENRKNDVREVLYAYTTGLGPWISESLLTIQILVRKIWNQHVGPIMVLTTIVIVFGLHWTYILLNYFWRIPLFTLWISYWTCSLWTKYCYKTPN